MTEIIPRFEFRFFGESLAGVGERLRSLAEVLETSENEDIYLVTRRRASEFFNVKIRDDEIDIKQLVKRHGELERWKPLEAKSFPLDPEFLRGTLATALGELQTPIDPGAGESATLLVRTLLEVDPVLGAALVRKHRSKFQLAAVAAEYDVITINGARIESVAVESEDPEEARSAAGKLGIDGEENVNYAREIRRVMGREYYPDQPWYHTGTDNNDHGT